MRKVILPSGDFARRKTVKEINAKSGAQSGAAFGVVTAVKSIHFTSLFSHRKGDSLGEAGFRFGEMPAGVQLKKGADAAAAEKLRGSFCAVLHRRHTRIFRVFLPVAYGKTEALRRAAKIFAFGKLDKAIEPQRTGNGRSGAKQLAFIKSIHRKQPRKGISGDNSFTIRNI